MFRYWFQERNNLLDNIEQMKIQQNEKDKELVRLQDLLERMQADKTKLSRRVSKLVLNGRRSQHEFRTTLIDCFLHL